MTEQHTNTDHCPCDECSYNTPCDGCGASPCYFVRDGRVFCSPECAEPLRDSEVHI